MFFERGISNLPKVGVKKIVTSYFGSKNFMTPHHGEKKWEFGKLIPEKYWYGEGDFGSCFLYIKTQFQLGKIGLASWEINIFSSCAFHHDTPYPLNRLKVVLKSVFLNKINTLLNTLPVIGHLMTPYILGIRNFMTPSPIFLSKNVCPQYIWDPLISKKMITP